MGDLELELQIAPSNTEKCLTLTIKLQSLVLSMVNLFMIRWLVDRNSWQVAHELYGDAYYAVLLY